MVKALTEEPSDSVLMLKARRKEDRDIIAELPAMASSGLVIIDDFHRLDDETRLAIADYLKLLADEEDDSTKIVVIGINRAGESLIHFAKDLSGRLDVIRFEANPTARVERLVREGSTALNIVLPVTELASAASGSFHLAQLLCHSACVASDILAYQGTTTTLSKPISTVIERVMDDLSMSFMESAMKFATGPRFSREGRAPYLHMLKWLSESAAWTVSLDREIPKHPDLRGSVSQVVDRGHLEDFLAKNSELTEIIHFDPRTHVLAVEDPKFYFFIRNLQWAKFAERVGYLNIGYTSRYDFALSFAGSDRPIAELVTNELVDREFAVFYDKNEQSRILASDVEEYLAPIYASEASFVLCIMGRDYPTRLWTRFESQQFRSRFGAESVIPIWFKHDGPSAFDESQKVGGFFIDRDSPLEVQIDYLGELLQKKITDYRLLPKFEANEFMCRQCRLVLNVAQLKPGKASLCVDCAEKWMPPTSAEVT